MVTAQDIFHLPWHCLIRPWRSLYSGRWQNKRKWRTGLTWLRRLRRMRKFGMAVVIRSIRRCNGCSGSTVLIRWKRAVLLTAEDYDFYDYFIGMDDENLRDMKRIFHGDPDQKSHLLMDYTANPRPVADPVVYAGFPADLGRCPGRLPGTAGCAER